MEFSEVIISTFSPLFSVRLKGTSFPLIRAPLAFAPTSVCILNAKSRTDEPVGSDFNSPWGVKTKKGKVSSLQEYRLKELKDYGFITEVYRG